MIRGFRHKGQKRFFELGTKSGIQVKHECRLRLMLSRLEVMRDLQIEPLLRIATEGTSSPKIGNSGAYSGQVAHGLCLLRRITA